MDKQQQKYNTNVEKLRYKKEKANKKFEEKREKMEHAKEVHLKQNEAALKKMELNSLIANASVEKAHAKGMTDKERIGLEREREETKRLREKYKNEQSKRDHELRILREEIKIMESKKGEEAGRMRHDFENKREDNRHTEDLAKIRVIDNLLLQRMCPAFITTRNIDGSMVDSDEFREAEVRQQAAITMPERLAIAGPQAGNVTGRPNRPPPPKHSQKALEWKK